MAPRRKNRTHLKGAASLDEASKNSDPRSFIIKHGQVGSSIAQLVRDMRKVMEPNTASRLKERTRNKLKDYLTMAPALHVTHLLAFTLTDVAPSLRLIRLSNGPTLSFRVERYSLMKDILKITKRARSMGLGYLSPPLLVLASFPPPSEAPPHLNLIMKAFQSLFPSLSPHTLKLSNARRVVLVAYNSERGTIDFRHYIITVKAYGVSKRVRRILEGGTAPKNTTGSTAMLDLGREKDIADFVLRKRGEFGPDAGYESAASSADSVAGDDGDTVNLADDYVGRNNKKGQRRAVRLDEVGPRLELRLMKITEGIPGKEGQVLYHEFVHKSRKEIAEQKAAIASRDKLRQQRREEQERNVARKKTENGEKAVTYDSNEDVEEDEKEWDDEEVITDGEEEEGEGDSEDGGYETSEDERDQRPKKKIK
ncbi:hypothetical protein E1B28_002637 [Marasmius oreades]|uniref:Brix domain-containing protein n=1 Tax=Marasmius oreades TaxID=181124 RepID=A0A9P7UNA7_9AGAR|nr:uncharacterized protein E1B28_002637 [Marasmius oreades]KAG7086701.1 hypothetical protein E1B28_002637 [Marasmius oreades]